MPTNVNGSLQLFRSQFIHSGPPWLRGRWSSPSCGSRLSARRHNAQGCLMNEVVRSAALTPEQLAVVNSGGWFAALEPAFQRAVLGSSRVMVLATGDPVFRRGDAGDGIYCVIAGAVRFGAVAPSGKESIVGLVEAPQWFGEIALFDGGPRTHDAWADITSTLLHLPQRHLTRILADDPGAWRQMGRLLVQKLRIALGLLEDMALEPPRVRL